MKYFLYVLKFPNGKEYVGISNNVERRWKKHCSKARSAPKFPVHLAIRKFGSEKVIVEILAVGCMRDVAQKEIETIANRATLCPNGYNLALGGNLSPMRSKVIAAKVSASKRGVFTPAMRTAAENQRGCKRSEEVCKKLSISHKGQKPSRKALANLRKLARARRGVPLSFEVRQKISAKQKGRKISAEHCKHVCAANRKAVFTPARAEQLAAARNNINQEKQRNSVKDYFRTDAGKAHLAKLSAARLEYLKAYRAA